MAGKSGGKAAAGAQRARLEKELGDLVARVDTEGLIFLVGQAQVLVHNLQVERLNREIAEAQGSAQRADGGREETGREPAEGGAAARTAVQIEEAPGGTFHLTVGTQRSTFGAPEMREVVRLCYAPETKSEALRALHAWFERERRDVLLNAGIHDPRHPFFRLLFGAVRARFRLKER